MTVSLKIREGTRVRFEPTPASLALYTSPPRVGAVGTVKPVSFGSGKRRTSMPGPGGGLVYVDWDDSYFQGVSSLDLVKVAKRSKESPEPTCGECGGGGLGLNTRFCRSCAGTGLQRSRRLEENPRLKKYRSLKELGADMQEWHSSGGDPIYAVGSFYYSGMDYPDRSVIEKARDSLESLIPQADAHMHGWKTSDANRLRAMVRALNDVLAGHGPSTRSLEENPRRPPKLWMRHCVRGVEESNRLYNREADPGSVCGSLWHHKMSPTQKREALRKEGKADAALQENPVSGAVIAVGTLLALGVGYLLLRDTTPATTATKPATSFPSVPPGQAPQAPSQAPSQPAPAPTCVVEQGKLTTWSAGQGKAAFYLPTLDVPVTLPNLTQQFPVISMATLPILLVTQDGKFWTYDSSGNPIAAPTLQASYCQSTGQAPVTPGGGGGTPIAKITTLKGSPSPFAWLA